MTEQPPSNHPSNQADPAPMRGDVPALLAFWLALRSRPEAAVKPPPPPDPREVLL
ncbi:MAG TPA: hypothetical protein VGR28_03290 [Candidatus Thermoplasmatota archaeon]|jgi:hypothetical protein|nr:hypothetical protein [Candidatus Thermoplasmatota archaeon]